MGNIELNTDSFDWAGGVPDSGKLASPVYHVKAPGSASGVDVAVVIWVTEGGTACAVCELERLPGRAGVGGAEWLANRWVRGCYSSMYRKDVEQAAKGYTGGLISACDLCGAYVISNSCVVLKGRAAA